MIESAVATLLKKSKRKESPIITCECKKAKSKGKLKKNTVIFFGKMY